MDTKTLTDICNYRKETVPSNKCDRMTFISTENMLPNKAGVIISAKCPTSGNVSKYYPGDVLVSNIRPYFKKIYLADKEGTCSNDVLVFFPKREVCTSDFLFCLLSTDAFFAHATKTAKGTKMPRGDRSAIMGYQINWVPINEQSSISEPILNIYHKIKLNEKINDNLMQQAEAFYRYLFIKNASPTWRTGSMAELVSVKYGKDHKKLADGTIPVYGSGGVMRFVERPLYEHESVLIPRKGSLNNIIYVNQPFWSVDTMFYTEMKLCNVAKYVYFYLKSQNLAAMNVGSAVPSMTTELLNSMQIKIPSDSTLVMFESIVDPMFKTISHNKMEIKKLTQVRDCLLKKLFR